MDLEKLKTRLSTTGYPVAYRYFKSPQNLPYICYRVAYSRNLAADSGVYIRSDRVQIELYTRIKDQQAEGKVEQALSSFFWEKTETYVESEKCYQIIYEIEV